MYKDTKNVQNFTGTCSSTPMLGKLKSFDNGLQSESTTVHKIFMILWKSTAVFMFASKDFMTFKSLVVSHFCG